MSEEQLTVEKINGASRTVDYRKHIAYTIDGKDIASCSIINFLLTHAAHLDSVLGASFNANDEIGMENIKLREKLATIERDTAEKLESLYPAKCPITRRDFFMVIEHPEDGVVPTYGGPFDSFTIPEMGGEIHEDMHERELSHHRYDHDAGCWVEDETIPLRVIHEDNLGEKP